MISTAVDCSASFFVESGDLSTVELRKIRGMAISSTAWWAFKLASISRFRASNSCNWSRTWGGSCLP